MKPRKPAAKAVSRKPKIYWAVFSEAADVPFLHSSRREARYLASDAELPDSAIRKVRIVEVK